MARRPERPKNRGRSSEGPLDWLDEQNQVETPSGPRSTLGGGWGQQGAVGGNSAGGNSEPVSSAETAQVGWEPVADPFPHPYPGPRADPRPRPDPGAPWSAAPEPAAPGPMTPGPAASRPAASGPAASGPAASGPAASGPTLGRRAARAQREAQQAAQGQAAQGQATQGRGGQPYGGQTQAGQGRQTQGGQGRQAQGRQAQGWQTQGWETEGRTADGRTADGRAADGQAADGQAGPDPQTQAGQGWQNLVGPDPHTQTGQGWQSRTGQDPQTQAGQSWQSRTGPDPQTQAGQGWQSRTGPDSTHAGQSWQRQAEAPAGHDWATQAGQGWPSGTDHLRADRPHSPTDDPTSRVGETPDPTDRSAHHSSHSSTPRRQRGRTGAGPADDAFGHRPDDEAPEPEPNRPARRRVAFWLTVAALMLALWSATSFIDSDSVFVAGLAAIGPLVTVVALPVIAIGVASKHVVPTAIAVVAAMLPWTMVTGYAAAGPGRHTVGSDTTLRVMTVDGARGRASAADIAQVTRLYEVDIVVVTELTSELSHELTVAGLASLAPARSVEVPTIDGHGTGIWSRPKINKITPITGLSQPGIDGAIEAGPTEIGISVVHLDGEPMRPGPKWRADLAELAKRPLPAAESFIVGDLNAGPWHPAFRKLTSSRWRDAANVVGQGLRPTWPSWSPLPIAPVDHVLVSPGLGVTGADTTAIAGSNHRALIVTLVIPRAGG